MSSYDQTETLEPVQACAGGGESPCQCHSCRSAPDYEVKFLQEALVRMGRVATIATTMLSSLPFEHHRKTLADNRMDGYLRGLLGLLGDARREMLERLCDLAPDCRECRIG
jgi:hypothetical protein